MRAEHAPANGDEADRQQPYVPALHQPEGALGIARGALVEPMVQEQRFGDEEQKVKIAQTATMACIHQKLGSVKRCQAPSS